jgi:MoxR-like ATPase
LLVRGEPGTGKTLLAENVAAALEMRIIRWHIKSTTKAKDGLYVYDTVARLHDSRFGDADVNDIRRYIRLGPLGQTLSEPERVVLLIDEIDKADIEFPNDLLLELDAMRFRIDETGDEITAAQRPFVLITSNNEKELPDAFLRRCIFHYIEFPDQELMKQIATVCDRCPSFASVRRPASSSTGSARSGRPASTSARSEEESRSSARC